MRRMPHCTYFWPGLPQLWRSGLWSGLFLAAGFAVLVDLLLLASFVWVEWLAPLDLRLGWMAAGSLWGASLVLSVGAARAGTTSADDLYREALREYLQGNWFEAESILGRMLRRTPRDIEGRLLLATLLRRTRRHDLALEHLDRLERLRDAARWAQEIAAERQHVAEQIAAAAMTGPIPANESEANEASISRQAA